MSGHVERAIEVADRINRIIDDTLRPMEQTIESWHPDFQRIMWESVATAAMARAKKVNGK